ncbi:hypothetical protein ACQ4PT_025373 [Festuca glaucescens]
MVRGEDTEFGTASWWAYAGISCFLVLFAGIMSGLSLGLMSLGIVDLEILLRSGTNAEKAQAGYLCVLFVAAAIFPVVQKQHQLLVTLLLCNACAMEALPIFLDRIFNPVLAVVLSVTFVLAFGEVIPQAICTRYGLAVGATFVWLVRILMIITYPISYPIGKLLDCALGHDESAYFRRAQLKALVSIHGKEAGKGGELTHDETTIISGALDLTEKVCNIFIVWEALGKILARGHSRVPVYSGNPRNVIGLLLVKSLLTVRAEIETPVSAVSIRRIPRVPADMPLYDILNEFQKGGSHMAAVVKAKPKNAPAPDKTEPHMEAAASTHLTAPLLSNTEERADIVIVDTERQHNTPSNTVAGISEDIDNSPVIGIITLEDVFEELLQGTFGQPGQPTGILKKPAGDSNTSNHEVNLVEPLL